MPTFLALVIFLLFNHHQASALTLNSSKDLVSLFSLRSSLNLRSKDWPKRADPCSNWIGVACSAGRVVGVNVSGLRRTRIGRLNPRFAVEGLKTLDRLESFNSTGFLLPGPVPSWFGSELPNSISMLVLRSGRINGTIPYSLGHLSNLRVLDLSHNSISGSIPATIRAIASLKVLNLSNNKLAGLVPDFVWSLELDIFDISVNNFTGTFPELAEAVLNSNVSSPPVFNLSKNLYYGSVSPGFWVYLQRFGGVDLSENYFQGTVPSDDKGMNQTNQSFSLNCFKGSLNQRNPDDCEKFYKSKGIAYDGPVIPNLAPPPTSSNVKKKINLWKYILGGVLGFIGLVIVAVLAFVLCFMRKRARTADQGGIEIRAVSSAVGPPHPSKASRVSSNINFTSGEAITYGRANGETFTFEQLVRATNEFSGTNLIKRGHSGDFYHGVLESGFSLVVKRIDLGEVGHKGYVAELNLFAKYSHRRLVPFLGQCSEKENEKFMIYKRVPYGDLSSALYKKPKQEDEELASLDWITRLKIAVGVAEALSFLHHECNPPLVHRDIQASSILLDDKYEVQLGSLSNVCAQEGDGHHNLFTRFLRRSQTSEQSTLGFPTSTCANDIYCFGKVLLLLVTGKLNLTDPTDPTSLDRLDQTLHSISIHCNKDSITKILDPTLVLDEDLTQEAWAVSIIAKSCLDPKPSRRPIARYVLKALENPLKIMRLYISSNSERLRTMSSRASWHGAFFGSWRQSSSDSVLKQSGTVRSQGSGGENSFSNKRHSSSEIFPEPAMKTSGDEA